MTSKAKAKGNSFERELVKLFTKAERLWGSSGKSRGLPEEVDLILTHKESQYYLQAKNWKWETYPAGFRSFTKHLLTNVSIGVIKKERDVQNSLVVMELKTLLDLLR
jgi:type II restriction/modification system DNA methylase subunit YeeA